MGRIDVEWCDKRMGLQIAPDAVERATIVEVIETRNLVVHNRGKVGNKYLHAVKDTALLRGAARPIDVDYLYDAARILTACAGSLDPAVTEKFGLPVQPFGAQGALKLET